MKRKQDVKGYLPPIVIPGTGIYTVGQTLKEVYKHRKVPRI
jgi:hypothetical protein